MTFEEYLALPEEVKRVAPWHRCEECLFQDLDDRVQAHKMDPPEGGMRRAHFICSSGHEFSYYYATEDAPTIRVRVDEHTGLIEILDEEDS